MAFAYVPSLHGSGALAPSGQYEPGLQATHSCSPSAGWYLPAAHLMHAQGGGGDGDGGDGLGGGQ